MLVEITSVYIQSGIVHLFAVDVSEENLCRMERLRDDTSNPEIEFIFDTKEKQVYSYLHNWMKHQKVLEKIPAPTWGQALRSIIGTVTEISTKYRSWE